MTDKEKLYFIEDYVLTLLNSRIELQLRKGRFGMSLHRYNKEGCAYLEGEVNALDKVRECIRSLREKEETDER